MRRLARIWCWVRGHWWIHYTHPQRIATCGRCGLTKPLRYFDINGTELIPDTRDDL